MHATTSYPELKIKIKSLAEESRIIRAEEKKHTGSRRNAIHNHRVVDVRRAQRATLIAYGYLRGRAYRQIEPRCRCEHSPFDRPRPDWTRVRDMIVKHGGNKDKNAVWDRLLRWRQGQPQEATVAA